MSYTDLGKATGLSTSAVHQRVRRLEQRGVIKGYTAVVDYEAIGLPLTAFISITPLDPAAPDDIPERLADLPEIEACHSVAGERELHPQGPGADARRDSRTCSPGSAARRRATRTTIVLSTPYEARSLPTDLAALTDPPALVRRSGKLGIKEIRQVRRRATDDRSARRQHLIQDPRIPTPLSSSRGEGGQRACVVAEAWAGRRPGWTRRAARPARSAARCPRLPPPRLALLGQRVDRVVVRVRARSAPRGRRARSTSGSSSSSTRCRARGRSRASWCTQRLPTNGTSQTIRGVAKPGR